MIPLPDPQAILDRGEAAEALLANKVFNDAFNDAGDFHTAAMLASPEGPSGVEAREHHHRMILAHRDLVSQLRLYVAAAEELVERNDALDDPDEPTQEID